MNAMSSVTLEFNDPRQNRLLAVLPEEECARIFPYLELVTLPLGDVLYESGGQLKYVYFPATAIVSLLSTMENGTSAEISIVGYEGVVGIALFMGGESVPNRAVVQSAGTAFRLNGGLLKQEFNRAGALQHLLLRYTMALLAQMAQTAVCNRHHSIDQQLCRWLLLSLDRLHSNELSMTQELIANMLGVRREGVTEAASPYWIGRVLKHGYANATRLSGPSSPACSPMLWRSRRCSLRII
jgi:CRP-like cAMP-binding protein